MVAHAGMGREKQTWVQNQESVVEIVVEFEVEEVVEVPKTEVTQQH